MCLRSIILLLLTLLQSVLSFNSHWVVSVQGGKEKAKVLALKHGFLYMGQVGELDNVYHFVSTASSRRKSIAVSDLRHESQVSIIERQSMRLYTKRGFITEEEPNDPLWNNQWTLHTAISDDDREEYNLRVIPAWIQGYTGKGVTIAIVDDGIDYTHPDLIQNYDDNSSFDFIHNDHDPYPISTFLDPNDHGTNCAGIVAMAKSNGKCGVGVAYDSKIAGLRLISPGASDLLETKAFNYHFNDIHIYSNSWGPLDNGYTVEGPREFAARAIEIGALKGRNGKGNIYVWASGNGGTDDCCAADGYVNSIYTIAIGSVDNNGRPSYFDEQCSAKMAVTFSYNSSYPNNINNPTTTLRGRCTQSFTGTSASAPLASGIIALALQANPSLSWRDVQYLIAYSSNSALLMSSGDSSNEWITNGRGLNISSQFGFGVMDAEAMVIRARDWINVPHHIHQSIVPSSNSTGYATNSTSFNIQWNIMDTNITYLEHIVLRLTLQLVPSVNESPIDYSTVYRDPTVLHHNGTRRGDIQVMLISPFGTRSTLLAHREKDFIGDTGYDQWPFMSVQFWGENPTGSWQCVVSYKGKMGSVNVSDIELKIYGVQSVPDSVRNIPTTCSDSCKHNRCSSQTICDSCKKFRDFKTLQCISTCPDKTYRIINNYCIYNDTTPQPSSTLINDQLGISSTHILSIGDLSSSLHYYTSTPLISTIDHSISTSSSSLMMVRPTNLNQLIETVLDKPKETPTSEGSKLGPATIIVVVVSLLIMYCY